MIMMYFVRKAIAAKSHLNDFDNHTEMRLPLFKKLQETVDITVPFNLVKGISILSCLIKDSSRGYLNSLLFS